MDYLVSYTKDNKFHIDQLINDDFFKAIKLCFNNRLYVSSVKLLLSFVDSISFVAYGKSDSQSFQNWLKEFCDLKELDITAFELWEHRNSMLHTTGLTSRKVEKKECRMLICYIGSLPNDVDLDTKNCGYYNLKALIDIIAKGIAKYINEKVIIPRDYKTFVERYDLIVSDVRTLNVYPKDNFA
jgi:hypothetical protein